MSQQVWKLTAKDSLSLTILLLVVFSIFLINPETIPAGGGFGFDGVIYARMVSELDIMISGGELSEYYAQRILPSLIVRGALIAIGLPLDVQNIVNGFRVFNCLLLVFSVGFWMAIAQHVRLTTIGFWAGILGLVLIFPNVKRIFYYPVLTDTFAFTIGIAMAWAHLTGRTFLVTILGPKPIQLIESA